MELFSYIAGSKLLASSLLAILAVTAGFPDIATCSPTNTSPNTFLEAIREKHHLPGLAAARITSKHGTRQPTISRAAVGVRKFGNATKMTPYDTFHLGSLSKAMTATLLSILMRDPESPLTWNTTVPKAFPHLSDILLPEHSTTTLAMLAAHHAGINDTASILANLPLWLAIENKTYTPVEGRRLVAQSTLSAPPITIPGSSYLYSNIGYMLLGHLIDTYPWNPPNNHPNHPNPNPNPNPNTYESLLHSHLWTPLSIPPNGCGFGPVPEPSPSSINNPWPHVPGANPGDDPVPLPSDADLPPALAPAGTVHCTIESYAKFLGLHLAAFSAGYGNEAREAAGQEGGGLPPLELGLGLGLGREDFEVLHTPYRVLAGRELIGGAGDLYTSGGWLHVPGAGPGSGDGERGAYLLHDGSNGGNYAWAVVTAGGGTGVGTGIGAGSETGSAGRGEGEAYFIATNVGGAEGAMAEVAEGLFRGTLGF